MSWQGALWKVVIWAKMAYLAKMAEMAINRHYHQTVNKNSELAKGPFGKQQFGRNGESPNCKQKFK